jgi:hypothetical protein
MDISNEEKNRRLLEKIRNRQNEIKLKSMNTTMTSAEGDGSFVSPEKASAKVAKIIDFSEPSLIESPTNKSNFPLDSFIKA